MSGFKDDYIGFTYNQVHSSALGIVRVSDGSRFNENLLPTIQDKTVQVPGGDGTYFFGSYYTQRQFSISFAFDNLTEVQLERLRQHFGDKQIHDLIFDERPYKVYSAKVTGTASIKYIPFSEGKTNRVYKGEGTIQFTCYYPFARCRFTSRSQYKTIPEYEGLTEDDKEKRIDEWWQASRIENGGNFGDVAVPFIKAGITGEGAIQFDTGSISWKMPEGVSATLNTKTGLALDENGEILNEYFDGDFTLKIPVGATEEQTSGLNFNCQYI